MGKILVFLTCAGLLLGGVTQAQVLNTADQPQVMGAEDANPPTLQLPSNPPSGEGSAEVGNGQGGSAIQGLDSSPTVKLNSQSPTLAPTKVLAPQDTGKTVKKDAIKPNTQGLENEPGLKAGGPKVGAKGLNPMRSPGSLLGNGMGKPPGIPGNTTGKSSLPGLTGAPTLPGGSKVPSATPGLPGVGKGKTTSSGKGNQLPGLPGTGKSNGLPGGNGGMAKIPKSALPDPSNPFGSRARGVSGAPGLGVKGQGSSPTGLGNSVIMSGGGKKDKKNKKTAKEKDDKAPLPDFSKKGNSKKKKNKKMDFSRTKVNLKKSEMKAAWRIYDKIGSKMAKNKATPKERRIYRILRNMLYPDKTKKLEVMKFGKKECNPNDHSCDSRSEEEKIAEVKKMLGRGGVPGQGDDMKPVQDEGGNDGSQGKILGNSVISQPSQDSQTTKSGGGRIVTDLEKTGNPGVSTD